MTTPAEKTPYLADRLQGFGTTIFSAMSALAAETGAVNLGQGFPDTDGPSEVSQAAIEAIRSGVNQYPPLPGEPDLRLAIAEHQKDLGASFGAFKRNKVKLMAPKHQVAYHPGAVKYYKEAGLM